MHPSLTNMSLEQFKTMSPELALNWLKTEPNQSKAVELWGKLKEKFGLDMLKEMENDRNIVESVSFEQYVTTECDKDFERFGIEDPETQEWWRKCAAASYVWHNRKAA